MWTSLFLFPLLSISAADETSQWLEALGYVDAAEEAAVGQSGVTIHNAEHVQRDGLRLYCMRTLGHAELIDSSGASVRQWSSSIDKHWLNCALDTDGSLMVVGVEESDVHNGPFVARYAPSGEQEWRIYGGYHHDIILHGETWLVLESAVRRVEGPSGIHLIKDNRIVALDRSGTVQKHWSLYDAIITGPAALTLKWPDTLEGHVRLDLLHANTIGLVSAGEMVPAGSVVVTLRHQDAVVILDPEMSKAIWSWGPGELRRPHEGFLVDGRLLVFDNDNDSRILAVDPVTKTITWRYESADFHSASRGGVVPLSGGNLLLTESNSGRSIEVTPDGEVVWEWKNPHLNEKGHRVTIRRMSWIPPENLPSDLQAAARP